VANENQKLVICNNSEIEDVWMCESYLFNSQEREFGSSNSQVYDELSSSTCISCAGIKPGKKHILMVKGVLHMKKNISANLIY